MLKLLSSPFGVFFVVFMLSSISVEFLRFGVPILAAEQSGNTADVAFLRGISFIPNILLGFFAGFVNDLIRKKTALVIHLLVQIFFTGLILLYFSMLQSPLFLISFLFILMLSSSFFLNNAHVGYVKETVDDADLTMANSLTGMVISSGSLLVPSIAGLVLSWYSSNLFLLICFSMQFIAVALAIRLAPTNLVPSSYGLMAGVKEGFGHFWKNKTLVVMSFTVMIINGTEAVFSTMLIVGSMENWVDTYRVGILLSTYGFGALIGSFLAGYLDRWLGYGKLFLLPIAGLTMTYCASASANFSSWVYIPVFFSGVFSATFVVGVWGYRHRTVSAETMGRVVGISGAVFKLAAPIFVLVAGSVTPSLGSQVLILIAGLVNFLVLAILLATGFWRNHCAN